MTAAREIVKHDPKGNTTLLPPVLHAGSDPMKIEWDFNNRPRAADTNGNDDIFYTWDAIGRRRTQRRHYECRLYFQSGQQTLADYASGTIPSSPTFTYVPLDISD